MLLTEKQKQLIHDTYIVIARHDYLTGDAFYARLFEIAPALRLVFPEELDGMRRKFVQTIGTIVAAVELNEDPTPAIRHLGMRHLGYGVQKEHYQPVGEAFLWALQQALDDRFTPEVREAWTVVYDLIAGIAVHDAYSDH